MNRHPATHKLFSIISTSSLNLNNSLGIRVLAFPSHVGPVSFECRVEIVFEADHVRVGFFWAHAFGEKLEAFDECFAFCGFEKFVKGESSMCSREASKPAVLFRPLRSSLARPIGHRNQQVPSLKDAAPPQLIREPYRFHRHIVL
jgi:hypothetical protein